MEKFSQEKSNEFVFEEQRRYALVFQMLNSEIEALPDTLQEKINQIEHNGMVPAKYTENFVQWPIEEIEEYIKKLEIDEGNIGLVLALRDALHEKIDNLRASG